MGAKKGRDHPHAPHFGQGFGGAQHLQFVVEAQPIARLDLDRSDALSHQSVEARQALGDQLGLGRGADGAHGRDDAAARAGDVFVGGAFEAQFEFVGAVAGIDQVGVRIGQGRSQ